MPATVRQPGGVAPGVGTFLALTLVAGPHVGLFDDPDEFVPIVQVNGPLTNETSFELTLVRVGDVLPYDPDTEYFPPLRDGPQLDPLQRGKLLDTLDQRTLQAAWASNELWMTATLNDGGDGSNTTTACWLQFRADGSSAPTLLDLGTLGTLGGGAGGLVPPGTFTAHASVDVSADGVAAFGFAAFSSAFYPSAYATLRDGLLDPPGTARAPAELVRAGEGPYFMGGNRLTSRWGDYSGISWDPANPSCFWVFNQYAANATYDASTGGFGSWRTAWARMCYTRPPACRRTNQGCSGRSECCSPSNKVCEGPPGRPETCQVCRRIGRPCSRVSQCCSASDKVCEGPPGRAARCKACLRVGQACARATECCNPSGKVCEGPPNGPATCQACRRRGMKCARGTQCCPGLGCSAGRCRRL
jgi:hypothetical protein